MAITLNAPRGWGKQGRQAVDAGWSKDDLDVRARAREFTARFLYPYEEELDEAEAVNPETEAAIRQAVRDDGAEAVVVGGGPLADAARALAATSPVPFIEAVPAAVRRMAAILSEGGPA